MTSSEKIWEIIQNKGAVPGTWRHKRCFVSTYSDEYVFIVVNEVVWYAVRIIVFDKPQKWGRGNLQVFKVSEHYTLSRAKEKAEELEKKLENIKRYQGENSPLPIGGFLKNEKLSGSVEELIAKGTWSHEISLYASDAHKHLRPLDILSIARGWYYHWAIYLGGEYVCHFTGTSVSGSSSSDSSGLSVKKDNIRTFFGGSYGSVKVTRPIIDFIDKYLIKLSIVKALTKRNCMGSYSIKSNNCEHFAKLIVLGLRHSSQGGGYQSFDGGEYSLNLLEEIRRGRSYIGIDLDESSLEIRRVEDEIMRLTTEGSKEAYGDWEARIEVNQVGLDNRCKLQ